MREHYRSSSVVSCRAQIEYLSPSLSIDSLYFQFNCCLFKFALPEQIQLLLRFLLGGPFLLFALHYSLLVLICAILIFQSWCDNLFSLSSLHTVYILSLSVINLCHGLGWNFRHILGKCVMLPQICHRWTLAETRAYSHIVKVNPVLISCSSKFLS